MYASCLTMRSCSESGGHIARVSAIGPSSSWPFSADFQLPLPRLQSMRALSLPSAPKASVYFDLSSGRSSVSSPPWNFTSCHVTPTRVPPGPSALPLGARPAQPAISAATKRRRLFNSKILLAVHLQAVHHSLDGKQRPGIELGAPLLQLARHTAFEGHDLARAAGADQVGIELGVAIEHQ